MNRILSWKINSGVYAYIYLPNTTSHISNRIAENSPLWKSIIDKISEWDESTYKKYFDEMSEEVEAKYGFSVEWRDEYWGFVDENAVGDVNIVLLSGKDGVGVAGEGEYGGGGGGLGDTSIDSIYEDFYDAIQGELDKVREDIEKENEEVKNYVEDAVANTIAEAESKIELVKGELAGKTEEMLGKLDAASAALENASKLFGDGNISSENIKDALSKIAEFDEWLNANSEHISDLKTDYDEATQRAGSIGTAEDVVDGLFSRFATALNTISGTVGTVERTMNASLGEIKDAASWYQTIGDSTAATEAIRFISASAGVITDTLNYVNGTGDDSLTVSLGRTMDAKDGVIIDEAKSLVSGVSGSFVTYIGNEINVLSATLTTNLTKEFETGFNSLGRRMDATEFEMEEYMTKFDEVSGVAYDLRDQWSAESGKISTVANLVAETNEYGEIRYFVSSFTNSLGEVVSFDEIEVKKSETTDENGVVINCYIPIDPNAAGGFPEGYVFMEAYPHLSTSMASYIKQTASSVTLSVIGKDEITAAIKLVIEDDEAIIGLVADKVVISSDLIAGAISAQTANIGGIYLDWGKIYCMKTNAKNEPMFHIDGTSGTITAHDAVIKGTISADTGYIGGFIIDDGMLQAKEPRVETLYYKFDYNNIFESNGVSYYHFKDENGMSYETIINNGDGDSNIYVASEDDITKRIGGDGYNITLSQNYPDDIIYLGVEKISDEELSTAIINASEVFEDDERGKLVFGAGRPHSGDSRSGVFYEYKLVDVDATDYIRTYQKIYLKKEYSLGNGDKNFTKVTAYQKITDENGVTIGMEMIPQNFYFSYKTLTTAPESPDVYHEEVYSPDTGSIQYIENGICIKGISDAIIGVYEDAQGEEAQGEEAQDEVLGAPMSYSEDTPLGANISGNEFEINSLLDFQVSGKDDIYIGGGGSILTGSTTGDTGGDNDEPTNLDDIVLEFEFKGDSLTGNGSTIKVPTLDNTIVSKKVINWGGYLKTPFILRPITTLAKFLYTGKSFIFDDGDYNTKIYSDGTIISKNVIAEDGFFGGDIDSDGVFRGELKDAGGTLKNVSITADTIDGSFLITNGKSFNAVYNEKTYLSINDENIEQDSNVGVWTIDSFSWSAKNKSGTNTGRTYDIGKNVLAVAIQSGGVITIPPLSGEIKRHAPKKRTNNGGAVNINCYILYNDNTVKSLYNYVKKLGSQRGKNDKTETFKTPSISSNVINGVEFEVNKSGYLFIELEAQVHLSTYGNMWSGWDRAEGSIRFNPTTAKAIIDYEKDSDGVHIGVDGFKCTGKTSLLSKNGYYGLSVDENDVYLYLNGKKYSFVSLVQKIETF